MNTQHKKLLAIAAVILFHGAVITVMLAQHGCKSDGTKPSSSNADAPVPAPAALPAPAPVIADTGFSAPTRPEAAAPLLPPAPTPVVQMAEPLYVPAPTPSPSSAITAAIPPSSGPAVNYVVSKGDTLTTVARQNGITVAELVAANAPKVTSATKLQPGMSLNIPNHKGPALASSSAPTVTDSGTTYKVVSGDSLSKIASRNHTTVKALRELNNFSSDNLSIGQVVKLPAVGAAAPAPLAGSAPAPAAGAEGTYTVKSGDSIDKIARTLHINSSELLGLNGLTSQTAGSIRPGRVLKLPAGTHAPATPVTTADALPPPVTSHVTLTSPSAPPPVTTSVTAFPSTGTSAPPLTPVQ